MVREAGSVTECAGSVGGLVVCRQVGLEDILSLSGSEVENVEVVSV